MLTFLPLLRSETKPFIFTHNDYDFSAPSVCVRVLGGCVSLYGMDYVGFAGTVFKTVSILLSKHIMRQMGYCLSSTRIFY